MIKYIDMDKIKDPFILQLKNTFGVTGFYFNKGEYRYIVGRPTQKKQETKREYRLRWVKFYKRGVE